MNFKKIIVLICLSLCIPLFSAKSNKPLTDAIIMGDLQKVEKIIARGTEVNFIDNNGYSPLMYAVIYDNKEILDALLKVKADVNATNENSFSALYYAVYNNRMNIGIVESLINNGADVNIKINNYSILKYTMDLNNKELFDILLKGNTDVNAKDDYGETPLIHAVKYNKKEFVESLINAKADINAKDRNWNSALHYAFINDEPEIIKLLINNGADINISISGYSPLIYALYSSRSKKEIIETLINAKADVNATDNEGRTPLMQAAIQKNKEVLELLIKSNVDVYAVDKTGYSALYYVLFKNKWTREDVDIFNLIFNSGFDSQDINKIKNGDYTALGWMFMISLIYQYTSIDIVRPVIELFLKKGANVNEESNFFSEYSTPFIVACKYSDLEMVKNLLRYGANVNFANSGGITPIFAAKNPEVLSELLKRGAKVNIKDKYGKTPLMSALDPYNYNYIAQNFKIESLKMLLDAGASVNEKIKNDKTILEQAIDFPGRPDAIKLLVEKGAKISDDEIVAAGEKKNDEIFYYLLNNQKLTKEDLTLSLCGLFAGMPLSYAEAIIKKGVFINMYIEFRGYVLAPGSTLLIIAVMHKNSPAVKFLLENGADKTAKEDYEEVERTEDSLEFNKYLTGSFPHGKTAMDYAKEQNNSEIIALLEKDYIWDDVAKGNIEKVKEYCKTENINIHTAYYEENFLFHAIRNDQTETAKILIDAGINLNAKNFPSEQTALHIAAGENNFEVVRMLLDKKANVNAMDSNFNTPYSYASLNKNNEIMELLIKAGAKKKEYYNDGGK